MPNDLKTNGYAIDTIEMEGLDYAVRHYIDGDKFKDPETARLWNEAEAALNALTTYLEKETGREIN